MTIREATVDDAPSIARVHVDSWRTTYRGIMPAEVLAKQSYAEREERWRGHLAESASRGTCHFFAVGPDGRIAGFATGGPERGGDAVYRAELYGIYLLEEAQRRGLGRRLLRAVARRLAQDGHDTLLVWVLDANPARHFYAALGGRPVKTGVWDPDGLALPDTAYGWDASAFRQLVAAAEEGD